MPTASWPRPERDRDAYARDAADRLAELTATARVVEWCHHGELAPLMEELAGQSGGTR
ncbi:MAG TPA: hypothetical protein VFG87_05375 [Amycolatopsis sp.]|jgi:hypothetical protein|nr:hypothetical protein [Amycolatopsis sp.]